MMRGNIKPIKSQAQPTVLLIPVIPVTFIKMVPITKIETKSIKENFIKKTKYFILLNFWNSYEMTTLCDLFSATRNSQPETRNFLMRFQPIFSNSNFNIQRNIHFEGVFHFVFYHWFYFF
jgi:hypothetical protein